ncbi:MAG: DsrE family protein [Verrucomicrobia bacterium]|nr:DsrE family protein [Verrucomicrobiota bacterium]
MPTTRMESQLAASHSAPPMIRGKKLGMLVSARPEQPNFQRALRLAEAALTEGVEVYFYCIDEAVLGLREVRLQELKQRRMKLFACALAARRRNLPVNDDAVFAGLSVVHEIMAETDRFVSFN